MTRQRLSALVLARRLRAACVDPQNRFTLLGEPGALDQGVCYHCVSGKHRNNEDRWILDQPGIPPGLFPHGLGKGHVAIVVRWPELLAQALFPPKPLFAIAHDLLDFLQPVIWQHDAVLWTDLGYLREIRGTDPFLASLTATKIQRFNRHLEALLQTQGFRQDVRRTMRGSLAPAIARTVPAEDRERAGKDALFLLARRLLDGIGFAAEYVHDGLFPEDLPPWRQVARYIADGFSATDGCWRLDVHGGPLVFVDWSRLVVIAEGLGLDWPINWKRFPPDSPHPKPGYAARSAFFDAVGRMFVAPRQESIFDCAEKFGLTTKDDLEHPWEIYSVPKLKARLARYAGQAATARQLAARRRRDPGAYELKPRIAYLDYEGLDQESRKIQVIRRRMGKERQLLFQVPYQEELPVEYALREHWEGKRYTIGSVIYWTLRGINAHANGGRHVPFKHRWKGEEELIRIIPPVPAATEFRIWAERQARELSGKNFEKRLFDERRDERIKEKLAGERKHLGPFAASEDEDLRRFFEKRGPGNLSEEAKKELLNAVPGRSLKSLLERRDRLGFFYAFDHGYRAYLSSGYCGHATAGRRRRWLAAGMVDGPPPTDLPAAASGSP